MASDYHYDTEKAIRFIDPSYNPGTERPPFCNQKSYLPETLDKLSEDYLKKLIGNMTDTDCRNTLDILINTNLSRERSEGAGFLLTEFGGGGMTASNEKNTGSENLGSSSTTQGCLTQLFQDFSQLSLSLGSICRSTGSTSFQTFDSTQNLTLNIETGPTNAMTKARAKETLAFYDAIKDLENNTILDWPSKKYFIDQFTKIEAAKNNNFNFGINRSQFNILVTNQQSLASTNNLAISSDDDQKDSMEETLKSQLTNDLSQKYGLGSAQLGSISEAITERVKKARDDEFNAIISLANEHKIVVNQNGSLTMLVRGPLNDITLDFAGKNMSFLRSEAVVKAINSLSKEVSDKLVYDILNGNVSSIEAEGLADLQKTIGESMANLADKLKPPSLFGDGGLGGLLGGGGMIFLIIFLLLFSGGGGGTGMKIVLILLVVVAAYVGIAYMFSLWPFKSKKEDFSKQFKTTRRYPYDSSNKFKTRTTPNVEYLTSRMGTRKKIKKTPYKR